MKAILLLVLVIVVAGVGFRVAGMPVPVLDYPLGPFGLDTPGPAMPDIRIEPPGFGDFEAP